MAEERTTSYSKNIHLSGYEKSVLDSQEALKGKFNDAASGRDLSQGQEKQPNSPQGRDSDMIKSSAPTPQLKPNNEISRAVDREAFDNKWNNESDKAKAYQEQVLKIHMELKIANKQNDGVNLEKDGRSRD